MGADLYIESVSDKQKDLWRGLFENAVQARDAAISRGNNAERNLWQEKVTEYYNQMYSEGYFRDSYNAANMLNHYGLSWWADIDPMLDEDGYLSIDKAKEFLAMLESAEFTEIHPELLRNCANSIEAARETESWKVHMRLRKIELMEFLELAIEINEPIRCSL